VCWAFCPSHLLAHQSQSGFSYSIKCIGALLSLNGMLVHCRLPCQLLLISIYTSKEASSYRVNTEKQNVTWPRFESRTSHSEVHPALLPLCHCSPSNRYTQLLNPSKGEMLLHSLLDYQLHRKLSGSAALVIWSV
jgi:hypothetical protein